MLSACSANNSSGVSHNSWFLVAFLHMTVATGASAHNHPPHAALQALEQLPTSYTPTMQPTNWKALLGQLAADVAASSR
jgi:hypothetical protein